MNIAVGFFAHYQLLPRGCLPKGYAGLYQGILGIVNNYDNIIPKRTCPNSPGGIYYKHAYNIKAYKMGINSKQAPARDPKRSYGFVLQDVARLMRRNFNRKGQEMGLTQAQWQALANISCREGLSQSALAEIMEAQPITVARLIDRMEEAGWVERRPDPNDRRAVCLFLAPKAQPILDNMWAMAAELRASATQGISDEEREIFLSVLLRIRTNLSEMTS